jgi:hypothetical protein
VLVQEGKIACTSFPPRWNDVQDAFVLVKEGKLTRARVASFSPRWHGVFRDALVLVQEGKLACASFLPWWNDVV